jgi:hypothetical protein
MSAFNIYTSTEHMNNSASLDCAIILTLEGSERTPQAVRRSEAFSSLVSKVVIQTNPGYKNIKKPLPVETAEADCGFCHYGACKYSLENGFENVLVLEDDFIVEDEYYEHEDAIREDIIDFLEKSEIDHYFLGCTPFLAIPWSFSCGGTWRVIRGGTAHAVIHSKKGMKKIVNDWEKDPNKILPVDLYMFRNRSFMHARPLVCQTFPETENKLKNWGSDATISGMVSNIFIGAVGLDLTTQPGYDIMYGTAKSIPIILFIVCVSLVIFLIIKKKKAKKK